MCSAVLSFASVLVDTSLTQLTSEDHGSRGNVEQEVASSRKIQNHIIINIDKKCMYMSNDTNVFRTDSDKCPLSFL